MVGVEEGVGQIGLLELARCHGNSQPAVVVLADQLEHPARHRDGNPVNGQFRDERVHHFGGRFPWDK